MSAFDFRTGQRIWNQPAGTVGFPWVAGDFIYTVTTEGQAVCISKLDGSVIWMTQLREFKKAKKRKTRVSWAGPVLAGERLMLFSSLGDGVVLNPYTGALTTSKSTKTIFILQRIKSQMARALQKLLSLAAPMWANRPCSIDWWERNSLS